MATDDFSADVVQAFIYCGGDLPARLITRGYDEGLSALGFAVLYEHFDILKLKQVKLDPNHPRIRDVLKYADRGEGFDLLKPLLEKGLNPNDQGNGGCSIVQRLLCGLDVDFSSYSWHQRNGRVKIDTTRARDKIKAIHLLAKHGARWVPTEKNDIKHARRSLLKLTPDYTIEFAWIMSKYASCSKECIQELIATPSMACGSPDVDSGQRTVHNTSIS